MLKPEVVENLWREANRVDDITEKLAARKSPTPQPLPWPSSTWRQESSFPPVL